MHETAARIHRTLVTFKIQGNGPVSAGQITIECCPQITPIAPGSGSEGEMVWTVIPPRYRDVRGLIVGEAVVTLATPEYSFKLPLASLTRTR